MSSCEYWGGATDLGKRPLADFPRLFREDFLQQLGGAFYGIFTNAFLLRCNHCVRPLQRLVRDVAIQIRRIHAQRRCHGAEP
ncbi:MAG: hypothetical protein ACJARU_000707 [Congregibacter sp.]|jgi:hypothetical protein